MAQREWRGFSAPRTAGGESSLVEPLPHHISVDALHVTFRADPARIARFLPPALDPVEEGLGWIMVGDLVKVPEGQHELLWQAPVRTQYSEAVLGFAVRHGSREGRYTALVWVDRDWSLGMGPIFGWGKRLATVDRTRLPSINPGVRSLVGGPVLGGTVHRNGHPVLRVRVDLADAEPLDALPGLGEASFLYRYVPSPSPNIPAVEQLLELPFSSVRTEGVQRGEGAIELFDAPEEELTDLGDVEPLDGFVYQRGWTTDRVATLVHDYAQEPGE